MEDLGRWTKVELKRTSDQIMTVCPEQIPFRISFESDRIKFCDSVGEFASVTLPISDDPFVTIVLRKPEPLPAAQLVRKFSTLFPLTEDKRHGPIPPHPKLPPLTSDQQSQDDEN